MHVTGKLNGRMLRLLSAASAIVHGHDRSRQQTRHQAHVRAPINRTRFVARL